MQLWRGRMACTWCRRRTVRPLRTETSGNKHKHVLYSCCRPISFSKVFLSLTVNSTLVFFPQISRSSMKWRCWTHRRAAKKSWRRSTTWRTSGRRAFPYQTRRWRMLPVWWRRWVSDAVWAQQKPQSRVVSAAAYQVEAEVSRRTAGNIMGVCTVTTAAIQYSIGKHHMTARLLVLAWDKKTITVHS